IYFQRDIKNGIEYDNSQYKYFNYVKQTVDGLELELTVEPVKNLSVSANYTLITVDEETQSRKNTNDTTYSYLLRRPKNNVNFTIGYQFPKNIFVSVSGKSVSDRHDVGGYKKEDVLLNSYFIVSAYGEYKYSSNVKFFVN